MNLTRLWVRARAVVDGKTEKINEGTHDSHSRRRIRGHNLVEKMTFQADPTSVRSVRRAKGCLTHVAQGDLFPLEDHVEVAR